MSEIIQIAGLEIVDAKAREDIKALQNETETIKNKLIVFGDSWSDLAVTDAVWSTSVAEKLNLTLHNYAKNAAGFIYPSDNLIRTQVDTFVDDTSVNKDEVKYIVVLAGINDYRHSVDKYDLATEIIDVLALLKSTCPDAKCLFVSNTQYPYTRNQSVYWRDVHNEIQPRAMISTYCLDGNYGYSTFNADNFFHLKQVGQKIMGSNIINALEGGELRSYKDTRAFSDDNISITYRTERISSNFAMVQIEFKPKVAATSYTFNVPSTQPNLCYGGDGNLRGTVSYAFENIICDVTTTKIVIASQSELQTTKTYTVDIPVYF